MKSTLYLILVFPFFLFSQPQLKGMVVELNTQNQSIPLPGANVFWLNTSVGTITSDDGSFKLPYKPVYKKLVISYVGFKTDTLTIDLSLIHI